MGAIVTCPLEVVKTRQQSSCSGFHIPKIAEVASDGTTCKTTGAQQRRRFWTSSYRPSAQVVALSGYVPHTNSVSLIQCLKHIIKYEGPLALFKGSSFWPLRYSLCFTRPKQSVILSTIYSWLNILHLSLSLQGRSSLFLLRNLVFIFSIGNFSACLSHI